MIYCNHCKHFPSALRELGIKVSKKDEGYCKAGIYMRYKRPKNANDTNFGFALGHCKGYCANGQ